MGASLLPGTLLMIVAAVSLILGPAPEEPVQLEAVTAIGALPPFIPSNGNPGQPQPSTIPVQNTAATTVVTGDTPGLYGGTRNDTCDAQAIRTYLAANPDKAAAWATASGLPQAQIGPFLDSLTPLTLRSDTAVTNNGFKNGRHTHSKSVLQAGTPVLVDPAGLPRVRCYCGNPLAEPAQQTSSRYTDPAWDGFSDRSVTVITKAPAEVGGFTVVKPIPVRSSTGRSGRAGKTTTPPTPASRGASGSELITCDVAVAAARRRAPRVPRRARTATPAAARRIRTPWLRRPVSSRTRTPLP